MEENNRTTTPYLTDNEKITRAKIALTNAVDPEVAPYLAEYGFTADRIGEGAAHAEEAQVLTNKQKREYGEQYAATKALAEKKAAAEDVYIKTVKIARIALKKMSAAHAALDLNGRRDRSFAAWLTQARLFYTNLQGSQEWMDAMARFGYTPEKLAAEAELIGAVAEAKAKQEKETGEAQRATHVRDQTIDTFLEWMHDFYTVAEVALQDRPQLREKLGMLERN
jgi:uncharacterized protein YhfF